MNLPSFYVLIDMNFLMYWHNTCKLSAKQVIPNDIAICAMITELNSKASCLWRSNGKP